MSHPRNGTGLSLCVLALLLSPPPASAQTTVEASVSSSGNDANHDCIDPGISPDGNFVVFTTNSAIDPADTNGIDDVYWHDVDGGATVLVSVASDGTIGNKRSNAPRVSRDGAFVVFQSVSDNLVAGDVNGQQDIFLHEMATGITTLISVATNGTQSNRVCSDPALTADGTKVVFTSSATNLVANDTNANDDIFLRDLATGVTSRVSVATSGAQSNGACSTAALSDDGNLVVFASLGSTLVGGDHNARPDIFLRDRAAKTTVRLDVAADGSEADSDSALPAISADGRFVAFDSFADNLVPYDQNHDHDVFVVEVAAGAIERVSVGSDGGEGNGSSTQPSLSADGRLVAFSCTSTNLIDGDDNFTTDTYLRDRALGMTSWMSLGDQGQTGPFHSYAGVVCADGGRVAFSSAVPDLVPNDHDSNYDVFVRLRDLTPAAWSNYGNGTAGTLGVPALVASAAPVLHTSFELRLDDSASWFTVAILAVGVEQVDLPAFGGELLVAPLFSLPVGLYPGTTSFTEEVPPNELLAGDVIYLQALELDVGAPRGVSLSPGLALTLGF